MAKALPPLWFVGLHETLAGSVIDTLPRTPPAALRIVVAERDATDLYRSLWPRYHELARIGIAALVIVGVVTTAACMWNSRRLPVPIVRRAHEDGAAGRAWKWMAAHVVARTSLRQAGFFFTLQTLSRQVSHRVALASSLAVGLSLVLITARGRVLVPGNDVSDVASVPLALLAGQWLLLASVLSGFRHAVRIPAELRASTTFSLAWAGNLTPYISGVKRAGWIALVLPTLGGLFIWHADCPRRPSRGASPRRRPCRVGAPDGNAIPALSALAVRERLRTEWRAEVTRRCVCGGPVVCVVYSGVGRALRLDGSGRISDARRHHDWTQCGGEGIRSRIAPASNSARSRRANPVSHPAIGSGELSVP